MLIQVSSIVFCLWNKIGGGEAASLVIPPANGWVGPDGPWSAFDLLAGFTSQKFWGHPGMATGMYVLPRERECEPYPGPDSCKGKTYFMPSESSTWMEVNGDCSFPSYTNLTLFDYAASDGAWGTDSMGLGNGASSSMLQVFNQSIFLAESIKATESRRLALFGMEPGLLIDGHFVANTSFDSLRSSSREPISSSYSYTAGSYRRGLSASTNHSGSYDASLILGGYDASRFDPSTSLEYPLQKDNGSSLIVNISAVMLTTDLSIDVSQTTPNKRLIAAKIDSAIPQIWLPLEICQAFERAFELTWNTSNSLYILNDSSHSNNLQRNTSIILSIGDSPTTSKNFTLPYSAFDLELWQTTNWYFPLKRAETPEQYMLGRAFLQEAYIIVDYERSNFSISQATFGGDPHIVDIPSLTTPAPAVNSTGTGSPEGSMDPNSNTRKENSLSSSAYVGIGIGVSALLLMLGLATAIWRRTAKKLRRVDSQKKFDKAELHAIDKPQLEIMGVQQLELEVIEPGHEVVGYPDLVPELEGSRPIVHELGHPDGDATGV